MIMVDLGMRDVWWHVARLEHQPSLRWGDNLGVIFITRRRSARILLRSTYLTLRSPDCPKGKELAAERRQDKVKFSRLIPEGDTNYPVRQPV